MCAIYRGIIVVERQNTMIANVIRDNYYHVQCVQYIEVERQNLIVLNYQVIYTYFNILLYMN